MSVDDETLIAFADCELSGERRAEVEAALAQDPALRARLEAHRALATNLSAAFDGALTEPVPAQLLHAAHPREANVVSLEDRRAKKWEMREWGAMAASLAAGLFIGFGAMNAQAPLIAASSSGLEARGALAHALDAQLASDDAGEVRIGLSFVSQHNGYCRTFTMTRSDTSGLACREGANWSVAMTARGGGGEVRTASAPAAILTAVDTMIDGEPLDRAAEADARARGWR